MKYKNIYAAIHNLGHSFLSYENYLSDGYVFDDLCEIHDKGHDITIDWINLAFYPAGEVTSRISLALGYYASDLEERFKNMNIEYKKLAKLNFQWHIGSRKFMEATDDRGKYYKIYVMETK